MGKRSRSGTVLTALASVLALVVGAVVALALVASYKMQVVEQRWERMLGSPREILERHPRREANGAARELEGLAARIGIELVPVEFRASASREHPEQEQRSRFKALGRSMARYRTAQFDHASRALDPPPVEVDRFLVEHEGDLETIRRALAEGDLPRWEMDIERLYQAPVPNLLGHLDLQKLFATDALAALAAGRRERALDDLEVMWNMRSALADDPLLITQITLLTHARLILGVLRLVEEPPPQWQERLEEWEVREPVERALGYEGWTWTHWPPGSEIASVGGAATRLLSTAVKPYVRYCLADASEEFHRRLVRADDVAGPCSGLGSTPEDLNPEIPRWNVPGRVMALDLGSTLSRVKRAEIDLELTARLIALEKARRANGGRWPAEPPVETGRFSVCPAARFGYEESADGAMTIALRQEVPRERASFEPPTRFTVR